MKFLKMTSALLAAASLLSLSSCGKLAPDDASTGGAGFVTEAPGNTGGTEGNTPGTPSQGSSGGSTTQNGGKVTEVTDFSFLADKTGRFSDVAGGDIYDCWYPGKVTRDLTTGEVTYNWDRAADTLAYLEKYGGIYRGDETSKVCYLTFDCGYEYRTAEYPDGVTVAILDVLKEKGVKGTFFVTGDYVESEWQTIQRMLDEGHTVGTHTMHHRHQVELTPEEFVAEIMDNEKLLKSKIPNAPDMIFYRPPEGSANEKTLALAQKMGLTTVFWSATQPDYNTDNQPLPATTLENDKKSLHNGCVYLLHAVSTTNAQILGDLIDYIQGEGYEIKLLEPQN